MIAAPHGYEPTRGPVFDGGTPEDRDAVLKLYYDYWLANDAFDNEALKKLWSTSTDAVYFNTNGHAYHGVDDWLKIWNHYRPLMEMRAPLGLGDVRVIIRGDMACVTGDRILRPWQKIGSDEPPKPVAETPYCRGTFVCVKGPQGWTTLHVHFSMGRFGPRPDQGGGDDAHVEAHGMKHVDA